MQFPSPSRTHFARFIMKKVIIFFTMAGVSFNGNENEEKSVIQSGQYPMEQKPPHVI